MVWVWLQPATISSGSSNVSDLGLMKDFIGAPPLYDNIVSLPEFLHYRACVATWQQILRFSVRVARLHLRPKWSFAVHIDGMITS